MTHILGSTECMDSSYDLEAFRSQSLSSSPAPTLVTPHSEHNFFSKSMTQNPSNDSRSEYELLNLQSQTFSRQAPLSTLTNYLDKPILLENQNNDLYSCLYDAKTVST